MACGFSVFHDTALHSSYGVSNYNVVADVCLFLFLLPSRGQHQTVPLHLGSRTLDPLLNSQTYLTEIQNTRQIFRY